MDVWSCWSHTNFPLHPTATWIRSQIFWPKQQLPWLILRLGKIQWLSKLCLSSVILKSRKHSVGSPISAFTSSHANVVSASLTNSNSVRNLLVQVSLWPESGLKQRLFVRDDAPLCNTSGFCGSNRVIRLPSSSFIRIRPISEAKDMLKKTNFICLSQELKNTASQIHELTAYLIYTDLSRTWSLLDPVGEQTIKRWIRCEIRKQSRL